jgi:DNA-directed RNA polymerase sigma subunit (sigma70/sigma32)
MSVPTPKTDDQQAIARHLLRRSARNVQEALDQYRKACALRDEDVIRARNAGMTHREIGDDVDVTEARVRAILKRTEVTK